MNKMQELKEDNGQLKMWIVALLVVISLMGYGLYKSERVSALTITTFNNSLANENLTFTGSNNFTRYLALPTSVDLLMNSSISISGTNITRGSDSVNIGSIGSKFSSDDNYIFEQYYSSGYRIRKYYLNGTLIAGSVSVPSSITSTCISANSGKILAYNNYIYYGCGKSGSDWAIRRMFMNGTYADEPIELGVTGSGYITDIQKANDMIYLYYYNSTSSDFRLYRYYINNNSLYSSTPGISSSYAYIYGYNHIYAMKDGVYGDGKEITELGLDSTTPTGNVYYSYGPENYNSKTGFITNGSLYYISSNGTYKISFEDLFQNFSLFVGSSEIFNSVGVYNSANILNNLTSYVNSYLSTCSYTGGYCNVPIIFHSDSSGILTYSGLNFSTDGIIENSQTYSSTVKETTDQNFTINVTYNNAEWSSSTANLIYDGLSYAGTKTTGTGYILFNKTITVPTVSVATNKTFYWQYVFTNTTGTYYYNSTAYNQTVNPTTPVNVSSTCPAGLSAAFGFDFKDETNLSSMNASVNYNILYGGTDNTSSKSTYGSISNTNQFYICINATEPQYTLGYGEIEYTASSYITRKFYLFANTRVTNSTINNTLYLLSSASATSFQETVEDTALNLYKGYYTSLLRWYPSLNQYNVVEMGKTDDKGQSVFRVKTDDTDYRIGVYQTDGTLVQLLEPVRFTCQVAPCNYNVFVTPTNYDYTSINGVEYSLTYSNTTKTFTLTWNDPAQVTTAMNLTVYKIGTLTKTIECTTSATGFTGLLTCVITGTPTGNYIAEVYRSASPPKFIASLAEEFRSTIANISPSFGLFFTVILVIAVALMGTFSPVAAIIFGAIALIPAYVLGSINGAVGIGIAILAGLIFWVMRRT